MGSHNLAAVAVWSPVMIAAAAGVGWSFGERVPDAPPVARQADRDAPLVRKGDYLIPAVEPPPGFAARWIPLAPALKIDRGPRNEGLPSIEVPSRPADPPSRSAIETARAEAIPHHQASGRHDRDVCEAHGMRRENFYKDNHWRSWRCVR